MSSIQMLFAAAAILCVQIASGTELTVLPAGADGLLANRLSAAACAASKARTVAYEKLKTPAEITAYQKKMRDFFIRQLGGFPERTPLNARVAGRGQGQGFRYEKILYDSLPGFTVTAVLYLPEGEGPFPGVLVPCGHSLNGKAAETYQRASILLAMNGLAALCYDPIGQGERVQTLDDTGKPLYTNTLDHMMVGVGSILVGRNTATYRIWDGMRGLDYLESRPDIDGTRLGCTGNSGGGTLTSYIMALDERVQCAAPSCYLTTLRRLLETIGPQDAEQNIYGQLAFGMDHPDYVLMRAPRPTLMCVATRDFFDIAGAWDNFRQNKRIYGRLGFPERMSLVETDQTHGFSIELRAGMVRWMRRWLLGIDDAVTEPEFSIFPDETLQCTAEGQVLLRAGQRSVYDLNAEEAERLNASRLTLAPKALREKIRALAGIKAWDDLPKPTVHPAEAIARDGYRIAKIEVKAKEGHVLPCLMFVPDKQQAAPVMYVHGAGKEADLERIERLVRRGSLVMAADLSGFGELALESSGNRRYDENFGPHWKDFYVAYLVGRSMVGIRAEEILVCAKALMSYQARSGGEGIQLLAAGEAVIPALHAAALEPSRFADTEFQDAPVESWRKLVSMHAPAHQLLNTVHGALAVYDLADLEALL